MRKEAAASQPLSDALDRLYSAPLEEFVALRRELASAMRVAGELPASRLVASATKPTRPAWALNQIARLRPQVLHTLFEARARAALAQKEGDAEAVRATVREYRGLLADTVRAVKEVLAERGVEINAEQARRISESLHAASAAGDEVRAALLAGRLVQEVQLEDPFGGLEAGGTRARRGPEPSVPESAASRKREAVEQDARERAVKRERAERDRAIEAAKQRVSSLEEKAQEAKALAREAEVAAGRAQSAAEKARRVATEVDKQLGQARAELRALPK